MIQVTHHFAAVIDGAGDPKRRTWKDHSLGWHAAAALSAEIVELEPGATPQEIVARLTSRLRQLREHLREDGYEPPAPAANVVLYSKERREVVRVGDCNFRIDGDNFGSPPKPFEQVLIDVRRLVLSAGQASNIALTRLNADVERIYKTLYEYQELCQNSFHAYSFPVIDGQSVPLEGVEVFRVGPGSHEVILASDGYPVVLETLEETEGALRAILATDPLLIGEYPQARGRNHDWSYDDRAYLRIITND